jgi:O-antigen/teichoic acid export membrane protein
VHQQGPSLKVLFVLIFLVPVEALDGLLMGLFASLASARPIFVRRHVLAPLLKLGVVLLFIVLKQDISFLAYGYLFVTIAGIVLYTWRLVVHLSRDGILSHFHLSEIRLPIREIFSFTLPLATSDILALLIQSVAVLLLGYYHALHDVAFYRVVLPAAALNQTIGNNSALLYLPAAARLVAEADNDGLRHLYWRTATWLVVITFPVFVATFVFARPVTILLYGQRYADAGVLLAILAGGYYYDIAFGFNGLTLKAMNKLGYFVGSNVIAGVTGITLQWLLIPRYGALGAAIGTAAILIVSTTLRQLSLAMVLGRGIFEGKFFSFYGPIALIVASLAGIRLMVRSNLVLAAALALVSLGAVLLFARKELGVAEVFPETSRIPLVGRFFHWARYSA